MEITYSHSSHTSKVCDHEGRAKQADMTGSYAMPLGATPPSKPDDKPKTVKLASLGFVDPHVDVTNLDPPDVEIVKTASCYALPGLARYPLDDYAQVKAACAYYEEYASAFAPPVRREFANNLVKRAVDLGITPPESAEKYASSEYGWQFMDSINYRSKLTSDPAVEQSLYKLASMRGEIGAPAMADALHELDKRAGFDLHYGSLLEDAYLSVLGAKTASEESNETSLTAGTEYTSAGRMRDLARNHSNRVSELLGPDFSTEFYKSPVSTWRSLPLDQRMVLIRMANEMADDLHGAGTK